MNFFVKVCKHPISDTNSIVRVSSNRHLPNSIRNRRDVRSLRGNRQMSVGASGTAEMDRSNQIT